jgi:hypothetical protein
MERVSPKPLDESSIQFPPRGRVEKFEEFFGEGYATNAGASPSPKSSLASLDEDFDPPSRGG